MFTAEADVTINRPLEEVFAFVSTPSEIPKWQHDVVESWQTSAGPLGVGTTGAMVRQSLGRRVEIGWEVTNFKANEGYTVKSTGSAPLSYVLTYAFTAVEGGTRVQASFQGEAHGLAKPMEGVIASSVKKDWPDDHQHLKTLLETRA
jgi:uncharacterized protein YndB with AHSA1/START domain